MLELLTILRELGQIGLAFVLALPIAWERERADRSAGLRTFPLVAAASCAFVMIGVQLGGNGDGHVEARIVQGLMTGIGFVGGGAILKQESTVHGTATAASIWMTGALGAAVGFSRWELAVIVCLVTVVTLKGGAMVHERFGSGDLPDAREPAKLPAKRR